jgi:hypothetical protein
MNLTEKKKEKRLLRNIFLTFSGTFFIENMNEKTTKASIELKCDLTALDQ